MVCTDDLYTNHDLYSFFYCKFPFYINIRRLMINIVLLNPYESQILYRISSDFIDANHKTYISLAVFIKMWICLSICSAMINILLLDIYSPYITNYMYKRKL